MTSTWVSSPAAGVRSLPWLRAARPRAARRGGARGWGRPGGPGTSRLPAAEPGPCASRRAGRSRSPGSCTVQREKGVLTVPAGRAGAPGAGPGHSPRPDRLGGAAPRPPPPREH